MNFLEDGHLPSCTVYRVRTINTHHSIVVYVVDMKYVIFYIHRMTHRHRCPHIEWNARAWVRTTNTTSSFACFFCFIRCYYSLQTTPMAFRIYLLLFLWMNHNSHRSCGSASVNGPMLIFESIMQKQTHSHTSHAACGMPMYYKKNWPAKIKCVAFSACNECQTTACKCVCILYIFRMHDGYTVCMWRQKIHLKTVLFIPLSGLYDAFWVVCDAFRWHLM